MEDHHHAPPPSDPAPSPSYSTREEVISLRSRRVKQLAEIYRDYYWSLMEDLRSKHREYYWKYGKSPLLDDEERDAAAAEMGESGAVGSSRDEKLGLGFGGGGYRRCVFTGCKSKAMALTRFCHPHILCDSKQVLYKDCKFPIKSGLTGRILCGRPVLRSNEASLCSIHFQKAEKNVAKALKKAGLNVAASTKMAPKFHLVVAEYVRHIQAKRRAAVEEIEDDVVYDEEYFDPFFSRKGTEG